MVDDNNPNKDSPQFIAEILKSWMMVALTLIFMLLYSAALFGFIPKLEDVSIIARLEPIIFVIIGYYFGRLPAQANETALKSEIDRQSHKAAAAQQIKENVQQEREGLEEKIKNAKIVLISQTSGNFMSEKTKTSASSTEKAGNTKQAIETAIKILNL